MKERKADPATEGDELESLDGEPLPNREAMSVLQPSAARLADATLDVTPAPDAGSTGGGVMGTSSDEMGSGGGGGIAPQPAPDAGSTAEADPDAETTKPPAE